MAGPLPRPKRNSTRSTPAVSPEEVLYTETDRSGDTLDVELASLCPNPFNKRVKKGVPELAATMKEIGLLQSIAHVRAEIWLEVYPETKDQITAPHVILYGEHRWLAAQELGWDTIPSVLRDDKVQEARLITLIENLRRAQLSPLEEAEHYQALREGGLSYEQVAEKVGETANGAISKGTVWKRIKLLDLSPEVQQALRDGALNVSAAQKAQHLDTQDQGTYLELVRSGVLATEALAQVLARPGETEPEPEPEPELGHPTPDSEGNGDGSADAPSAPPPREGESVVSTGNADDEAPSAKGKSEQPVSSGNAARSSTARRPPKPRAAGGKDKNDEERRAAAAAREAACRSLVQDTDVMDPSATEIVLPVLTETVLAPPLQSAAQQRAFTWLKEANRQEVHADDATTYFSAVQDSTDAASRRRAAFAVGLAAAEIRTAARRQSWGAREHQYLQVLQQHAEYQPQTEWEQTQLGANTGDNR